MALTPAQKRQESQLLALEVELLFAAGTPPEAPRFGRRGTWLQFYKRDPVLCVRCYNPLRRPAERLIRERVNQGKRMTVGVTCLHCRRPYAMVIFRIYRPGGMVSSRRELRLSLVWRKA